MWYTIVKEREVQTDEQVNFLCFGFRVKLIKFRFIISVKAKYILSVLKSLLNANAQPCYTKDVLNLNC